MRKKVDEFNIFHHIFFVSKEFRFIRVYFDAIIVCRVVREILEGFDRVRCLHVVNPR